ncbi:hypothetical protein ACRAWG_01190 [Methylobacterium sp. P31]
MAVVRPESLAAIEAEIADLDRTIATLEEVLERQPPGCEAELHLKMALEKGAALLKQLERLSQQDPDEEA